MRTTVWAEYVRQVIRWGAESPADIPDQNTVAERAGVSQGTVSRWLTGKKIPTEAAAAASFARAFHRNVLEAFVAADMLKEDEAGSALSAESRTFLAWIRDRAAKLNAPIPIDPEPSPDPLYKSWDTLGRPIVDAAWGGGSVDHATPVRPFDDVDVFVAYSGDEDDATGKVIRLAKQLAQDPAAGSGAFIVTVSSLLAQAGHKVPHLVWETRSAIVHGRTPGEDVVAEAEQVLRAEVEQLDDGPRGASAHFPTQEAAAAAARRMALSAGSGEVVIARAAHEEEGSIAGEQEQPQEP